ncbi:hypothetical protein D3C81_1256600 [compost metagenome]
MDLEAGVCLPGEGLVQLNPHVFFADFEQLAEELLATAVEQLYGIASGHAQYPADVVGLGFGQVVLAEAQGGVDEEAGQSHFKTRNMCWSIAGQARSHRGCVKPVGAGLPRDAC